MPIWGYPRSVAVCIRVGGDQTWGLAHPRNALHSWSERSLTPRVCSFSFWEYAFLATPPTWKFSWVQYESLTLTDVNNSEEIMLGTAHSLFIEVLFPDRLCCTQITLDKNHFSIEIPGDAQLQGSSDSVSDMRRSSTHPFLGVHFPPPVTQLSVLLLFPPAPTGCPCMFLRQVLFFFVSFPVPRIPSGHHGLQSKDWEVITDISLPASSTQL